MRSSIVLVSVIIFIWIATAIIIPSVSFLTLIQYYFDLIYMARIARYIVEIEWNINHLFKERLLFWESGIREWTKYKYPKHKSKEYMLFNNPFLKFNMVIPIIFVIIDLLSLITSIFFPDNQELLAIQLGKINFFITYFNVSIDIIGFHLIVGVILFCLFDKKIKELDWSEET